MVSLEIKQFLQFDQEYYFIIILLEEFQALPLKDLKDYFAQNEVDESYTKVHLLFKVKYLLIKKNLLMLPSFEQK